MALRHLQLLRNSGITQTRESALSTASGKTTNLKDGDVIVARYLISGGSAAEGNVAVAVGHKVGGENGGYIVWNDNQELKELISASTASTENLEKAVGVAHNASAITFDENVEYIENGSAKDALEALDTNLQVTSGKVDDVTNAFTTYATNVVGAESGSTGLGATGTNITNTDTVKGAVQKLDAAIESGDTATDNLRKAVGAASGESTMAYPNTNYIASDTTVSGALVTLDTNLEVVSGKSESALTYVDNLDKVVGVNNSATAFTTTGEVASSTTTVKDAVEALDEAIVELSGASTTDLNALRAAVGVAKGVSSITIDNAHYATGTTTVVTALTDIDEQLYSATTSVDKAHQFLGTQSGDTSFGVDGNYVTTGMTVKEAVDELDDVIKTNYDNDAALRQAVGVNSGDTTLTIPNPNYVGATPQVSGAIQTLDTVEKATRDTIGVSGSGSGLSLNGQHYISGDPTVVSALTDLDTNLYELSGKATSNTILAQNPISSQTIAVSGTTVGLKLDAVITDAAVTSSAETEMHKNILAVSENGLYALADLHYDATLNKLTYVNTNGKKDIQLTGVKVFDEVTYISSAETIDLSYTDLSGGTKHVYIPVGDIIEEYSFQPSETPAEQQASSEHHNVSLVRDRHVSGATEVYGELSVFDCGEY